MGHWFQQTFHIGYQRAILYFSTANNYYIFNIPSFYTDGSEPPTEQLMTFDQLTNGRIDLYLFRKQQLVLALVIPARLMKQTLAHLN